MEFDMKNIEKLHQLAQQVETILLGKPEVVRKILLVLLAKGHILLEDVPGVGKTLISRSIAESVAGEFSRIQLTPDLLPSDILGVSIYDSKAEQFHLKKGPLFANFVLADEINRTTPRTQSALLEAMNEQQITADGVTYPLGPVFMVLATQNPYEFEGTYFLPENQLDRFMMRIEIGHPSIETEKQILLTQPATTRLQEIEPVLSTHDIAEYQNMLNEISVHDAIIDYILEIARATRNSSQLWIGLSTRATLSMMQVARANALLEGRNYVVPDDVKQFAMEVCSHRLVTKNYSHNSNISASQSIFQDILDSIPVPR